MGKLYRRDGRWGIDYRDARNQRVRRIVAGDRSVAAVFLSEALKSVEKVKAGVLQADPREGKKAFDTQVDAYLSELKRLGRDDMYRYTIRKHLDGAAESQSWARLTDATPQTISARLKQLADAGLSPKTQNAHRADLNAFLAWCQRTGRLEANPCVTVPKTAERADKKRRALSVAEIRDLLAAAPPERAICYLFLVYTGLRRAEAAQIKWAHVHLDGINSYIELPPTFTKSGHAEAVPLVPELAAALREHRGDAKPGDPVFAEIPSMPDFRDDLADAGIAEVDARGRKVVLHSLRHSLATMLAASGVPMPGGPAHHAPPGHQAHRRGLYRRGPAPPPRRNGGVAESEQLNDRPGLQGCARGVIAATPSAARALRALTRQGQTGGGPSTRSRSSGWRYLYPPSR